MVVELRIAAVREALGRTRCDRIVQQARAEYGFHGARLDAPSAQTIRSRAMESAEGARWARAQ
jgi:hypothetical protein